MPPAIGTAMLAPEQTLSELTLPALDCVRSPAGRAAPAVGGAVVVLVILFTGGRVHALSDVLRRTLSVSPAWAVVAIGCECLSILAYILLLSLVAGGRAGASGKRESAQITLAGTAATRLLPTAGAGGAALTLWTLRRAGLRCGRGHTHAARVPRLAVFRLPGLDRRRRRTAHARGGSFPRSGGAQRGPRGSRHPRDHNRPRPAARRRRKPVRRRAARQTGSPGQEPPARLDAGAHALGDAIDHACRLLRARDPRLSGRSATGRSTPPCCGRRCTRSAPPPRCRSSCSRTSSARSPTRCRSRARSAAGSQAC